MVASRSRHQDAMQAASAISPSTASVMPSMVTGPERSVIAAPISTVRKHRAPTRAMALAAYRIGFARRWQRPSDIGSVPAPGWSLVKVSPFSVPDAIKNSAVYTDLEDNGPKLESIIQPAVGRAGSGWQSTVSWA